MVMGKKDNALVTMSGERICNILSLSIYPHIIDRVSHSLDPNETSIYLECVRYMYYA